MEKSNKKLTFCIDVDGTIFKYKFPEIGEPVPHAFDVMRELQDKGHKIILHTIRSDTDKRNYLGEAATAIMSEGIDLYGLNYNKTQKHFSTSPKTYGNYYIDDAALGTPLIQEELESHPYVDWLKIRQILIDLQIL